MVRYRNERTEGVPCGKIYCMAYDENYDMNCDLIIMQNNHCIESDPYVSMCSKYVPEGGDN